MANYCAKLWLLVWKNWLLQVRNVILTLCQILLPVLLVLIAFIMRISVHQELFPDETRFPAFNPSDPTLVEIGTRSAFLRNPSSGSLQDWELAWSTQESAPASFTDDSLKVMQMASAGIMPLRQFSSPAELEKYMTESARLKPDSPGNGTMTLAGVVIEDEADPTAPKVCSRRLKVTLRFHSEGRSWSTGSLFWIRPPDGPLNKESTTGAYPFYTASGFTALQAQVSRAVAVICAKQTRRSLQLLHSKVPRRRREPSPAAPVPDVRLRRYPYPPYYRDPLEGRLLTSLLVTTLVFGVLLIFVFTAKGLTEEKALQIKETLKIIGVPTSLHWLAWFIKTMSMLLISMLLVLMLLNIPTRNGAILNHSSPLVVFIFFALFSASLTFFAFMISAVFSNANLAATSAAVLYATLWLLYFLFFEENRSFTTLLLLCLTCPGAMGVGVEIIMMYESYNVGQQWTNLLSNPSSEFEMSMGMVWLLLIVNCLIYMLIALYIEAIRPGEYGVPKPWYFLCQKSYWRPQQPGQEPPNPRAHKADSRNVEDDPPDASAGVCIDAVTKVYPGNKMAVDNLSLNMYEGQITVLLGHNGAGKTTTISMITGMLKPTSGSVTVGGYDVRSNAQQAREGMGFCAQHNVLFDELTVREHLYFFAKLKGLTGDELKEEIDVFLKVIQMEDKKNKKARTLSGGMKRKLAVCVALCGKSKVVFLDEPTSGMDPAARRALWDLLREMKAGRTLLLTTHMMDEADVLGDRIAIMAGGRLQCYGSPFFLKKRFGGGYHLVVVKGRRCSTSEVTKLLAKHIQGVKIDREAGFEVVYQLDDAQMARFEPMLADLERSTSQLDVVTFGVSLTTMEEVFLKVSKEYEVMEPSARSVRRKMRHSIMKGREQRGTGRKLLPNQVRAMCLKKNVVTRRAWPMLVLHLLIPAFMLLFMYFLKRFAMGVHDPPALSMIPENYKKGKTVIAVGTGAKSISKNYQDLASDAKWTVKVLDDQASPSDAFENQMLDQYKADRSDTELNYVVGASFEKDQATGWFNDREFHALPLALSMVYNAHLKSLGIFLHLVNHPLPYSTQKRASLVMERTGEVALPVSMGMMFLSCYFILFLVRERSNNAKHMQIVSGANVLIFWGVHFIFDFFCFLAGCAITTIVLAILQIDYFSTDEELGRTFAVFICFVCANLPFIYLVSLMFKSSATAYAVLLVIYAVGIVMDSGTEMVMKLEVQKKYPNGTTNTIQWICFPLPIYTLNDALNKIEKYSSMSGECPKIKPKCSQITEHFCCPGIFLFQ